MSQYSDTAEYPKMSVNLQELSIQHHRTTTPQVQRRSDCSGFPSGTQLLLLLLRWPRVFFWCLSESFSGFLARCSMHSCVSLQGWLKAALKYQLCKAIFNFFYNLRRSFPSLLSAFFSCCASVLLYALYSIACFSHHTHELLNTLLLNQPCECWINILTQIRFPWWLWLFCSCVPFSVFFLCVQMLAFAILRMTDMLKCERISVQYGHFYKFSITFAWYLYQLLSYQEVDGMAVVLQLTSQNLLFKSFQCGEKNNYFKPKHWVFSEP